MYQIKLSSNEFNPNGYWSTALPYDFIPQNDYLNLFDQNGYDLTELEKLFAAINHTAVLSHREHRSSLKQEWFTQEPADSGPILNHSLLFERKGYSNQALEQLKSWTDNFPRAYQLISLRPKWGLDFSMDYVDRDGNCFEILHWEYDGFDYNEIQSVKEKVEPLLLNVDWNNAAQQLLIRKNEWHHLDFFAQSDWKCNYFGITKERFKMVAWE